MKGKTFILSALIVAAATCTAAMHSATNDKNNENMATLNLTSEWDKTFPLSDKVNHSKVTFTNRYGITLAADMYSPRTPPAIFPPSPSADLSARSRSRLRVSMPSSWPSAAS